MEKGASIEITIPIAEYGLKKLDRGIYIKKFNMGIGMNVDLYRILIHGKEYQLKEDEFVNVKEETNI